MHYAELHAKTNFSFLEGASHPEEIVTEAANLSYAAVAVTDLASFAGAVRAHQAAKDIGMELLLGTEIHPEDAAPIVLLATDRAAYGNLCRLITRGRRRAEKGECTLRLEDVAEHAAGSIGLCLFPERPEDGRPVEEFARYREILGDRCYLAAKIHRGTDDTGLLDHVAAVGNRLGIPAVASGDVHYHAARRQALHDALTAIRLNQTVREVKASLYANAQRHLRPLEDLARLYRGHEDMLRRTLEVARRCAFSLDELRYTYPRELSPPGSTPMEYLRRLTEEGARRRYPGGVPAKVRKMLEHELGLIEELRYEAYFLTVWDLVRFAQSRGILCQGRGSAANSAVCFCLEITSVDPDRIDLLFERFISRERNEAPDIDVDFEHERREEVLQYLYDKYGRDRAAMTAEVIRYRPRSAARDIGKALGLSEDRVDEVVKRFDHYHQEPDLAARCREAGLDPESLLGSRFVALVNELVGFPRHLSQHTGGMVMTDDLLCETCPIENAAMPERTVIQWNKDDLDELGILKVDCLALGMLSAIRRCFELIEKHHGIRLTPATVPAEDEAVYEMIRAADTVGVFQIESRAQMAMLPRLKPKSFYDLVIEVAIVRPGPIQGQMVHPYLRRREGEETVTYPSEEIRAILEKTLGVPLFQEQAMRLAVAAAGFTPGEADQLRRAMGAWRRPGLIERFRRRLIEGMLKNGFSREYADSVFSQIRGFGEYGFPESHAASFALLVYVSSWLKRYYPAAFTAALLNSQPMGFYAPAQLIQDARRHGVPVRPADVNASDADSTLEPTEMGDALRLGLNLVNRLPEEAIGRILEGRRTGPYRDMDDFARRTGLERPVLNLLAEADAFESLQLGRRAALWDALAQDNRAMPLFDAAPTQQPAPQTQFLARMTLFEETAADYGALGFSLKDHPMRFLRPMLEKNRVVPAADLEKRPDGRRVKVAGLVLNRQRPGTAKGVIFITLEDETGQANLIIRPDVAARYRQVVRGAMVILADGRLQKKDGVIHVLPARVEDWSGALAAVKTKSRDFQ